MSATLLVISFVVCQLAPLLSVTATKGANDETVEVRTALGRLRGNRMSTWTGRTFIGFRGVPYAEPPVGRNRFKPPVPLKPWVGIRNAMEDGAVCPQPFVSFVGSSSEDCLFLNVYTQKLQPNEKYPVIVFFHPGGFYSMTGASYWTGPHYLLDQEIVLVTLNYRLDALGFLSTGDAAATGNYGLKDQVAALRWVKQNIAPFGGNPDSVTIAGYSAGGGSVQLHMVSPMSRGLFHNGIAMSGAAASSWAVNQKPLPEARRLAAMLNCEKSDTRLMIDCLRNQPAQMIPDQFENMRDWASDPMVGFSPVIEPDLGDGAERFLTDNPIKLIQTGQFSQVPLVTGFTADEFAGKALVIMENSSLIGDMNGDWERIAPIAFQYERNTNRSKDISSSLRYIYIGEDPIANDTRSLDGLAKLYSDSIIIFGAGRSAKLIAQHSNKSVYFYDFNYKGRYSHVYKPGSHEPYGTVHHDDLIYLFFIEKMFPKFNATDPEAGIVRALTSMWAKFARNGNPTPDGSRDNWTPLSATSQHHLSIGKEMEIRSLLPNAERIDYWEDLISLEEAYNR